MAVWLWMSAVRSYGQGLGMTNLMPPVAGVDSCTNDCEPGMWPTNYVISCTNTQSNTNAYYTEFDSSTTWPPVWQPFIIVSPAQYVIAVPFVSTNRCMYFRAGNHWITE